MLLVLSLGTASAPAWGQTCPEPSSDQIAERAEILEQIIDSHSGAMNLWWSGFMGLHMTMAATMTTVQNFQSQEARRETAVGIVGSALGATTLLLVTPPLLRAPEALGPIDRSTDKGRRTYVQQAEQLLAQQAKKSRLATSWFSRIVSFAYTTAAAIFIWRVLDRDRGALRNFVGGLVIGQARSFSHPTGAAEAWAAYHGRYIKGCGEGPALDTEPAPTTSQLQLGAAAGGLGFTLRF